MKTKKSIGRRKLLVTSAAFAASTAVGTLPLVAASKEERAIDAFYQSGEFTFCDVKYLASMWSKSNWDAKVFAGQKIVDGALDFFRGELKYARQIGLQRGQRCQYEDADNPGYRYRDVERLARYWRTPTVWDAKLKIGAMLEQGLNLTIRSDLRIAR